MAGGSSVASAPPARRLLRSVVVFLALLPMSVGVVAAPAAQAAPVAAAAAAGNGARVDAQIQYQDPDSKFDKAAGNWFECTVPMFWSLASSGVQLVQAENVACTLGYSVGREWDIQLTWKGTSEDGSTCLGTSGQRDEVPLSGGWGIGATMSDTPCEVDTFCYVLKLDRNFWTDGGELNECQSIAIGGPGAVDVPGECEFGTVSAPMVSEPYKFQGTYWNWRFDVSANIGNPVGGSASGTWLIYYVFRYNTATPSGGPGSIPTRTMTYKPNWFTPDNILANSFSYQFGGGTLTDRGYGSSGFNQVSELPAASEVEVVGVGVYREQSINRDFAVNQGDYDPLYKDRGIVGKSDPSRCTFYWGEKVYDRSDVTTDDPIGGLSSGGVSGTPEPPDTTGPAPEGEPGSCDFSWTNPSTWATAGICQLVKLMGAVIGLLGDIARAIAGIAAAILDGLAALFIPSPSSWGVDGLVDTFAARPPGSVVTELGDIVGETSSAFQAAGGGCNLIDGAGTRVPSLSCAQAASMPGVSGLRALVIAGMWLFTGWGMFTIISKAVGREGES